MPHAEPRPGFRDPAFLTALSVVGGSYALLIVAMLAADAHFLFPRDGTLAAVFDPTTRYAVWLGLFACGATALLTLRRVPIGPASPTAGAFGPATRYAVRLGLVACGTASALALLVSGAEPAAPSPHSLAAVLAVPVRCAVWVGLVAWTTTATLSPYVVGSGALSPGVIAAVGRRAARWAAWVALAACVVTAVGALYFAGSDLPEAVAGLISPQIRYSFWLSLVSCSATALLSLFVAVPLGYLLSRFRFPFKWLVDALLDIPIVLPPLVIGLSLLILFQTSIGRAFERFWRTGMDGAITYAFLPAAAVGIAAALWRVMVFAARIRLSFPIQASVVLLLASVVLVGFRLLPQTETVLGVLRENLAAGITYEVPGVILAQFAVACAFAVRTMRVTFDDIPRRREEVALTLGCGRAQAFWRVVLPEARRGMVTAATLAWARALGEFGPILVFAGATRLKTEVLSTTVFLELSVGNLRAAVAVSLLMVLAALVVLLVVRRYGMGRSSA